MGKPHLLERYKHFDPQSGLDLIPTKFENCEFIFLSCLIPFLPPFFLFNWKVSQAYAAINIILMIYQ
jgi:hypothetical protein